MIRVRDERTGRLSTAAVCPGCWGSPDRRADLVKMLARRGLAVAHADDEQAGRYKVGAAHAPGCPYGAQREGTDES